MKLNNEVEVLLQQKPSWSGAKLVLATMSINEILSASPNTFAIGWRGGQKGDPPAERKKITIIFILL